MANIPNGDENQFEQLINACDNDPILSLQKTLQTAYESHRTNRNALFNEKISQPGFCDWKEDQILNQVLEAEKGLTNYVDPRSNLAFWARPPQHVRELVSKIQQQIATLAGPGLWFVPPENLHMTTLEICCEKNRGQITELIDKIDPKMWEDMANYTLDHRARLVKPVISYDTSALALSFVPAAGEDDAAAYSGKDDGFTYHHLRRDLYNKVTTNGVPIGARYTVPSAHVTIARVVKPAMATERNSASPVEPDAEAAQLVTGIEDLNCELRSNVWRRLGDPSQGEWVVGHEKGLELIWGTTCECNPTHQEIALALLRQATIQRPPPSYPAKSVKMVNIPKTRRTYCKSKDCHKHTQHKVTQYKAGKASLFAQGKRRYDRKQSGYGGQTKPVFHKKAKTTKKVVLRLECTQCKTKKQLALKRCKHFELGGDKKTKGAALVF
ncbi:unnamed protein product [Penicillium salamii]|uniref:60S ribosomal protein L44 n=1 Tax=Penicillium salamii TaxID=1612424 RepID=A0A9W4NW40_9EURO|nr:unnamed protein product [Penicillium salamii]CAG8099019.1 unnamed protein product [Penicillium salamii]CAG8125244.1 unnamed protein product [Penicillium salamii]CAG8130578.1 unnamed protein product [Penicillium salamii]CAG8155012.1 unnamed protein product [Penicillium salamii]